jgi:hypothetical protein
VIDLYLIPFEETVCLSQSQMAELLYVDRSGITQHINKVYKDVSYKKIAYVRKTHTWVLLLVQRYKVNTYSVAKWDT